MKLSKIKKRIIGSLKGLSGQEYYAITELKNPVALARQFLSEELFKKFDRGKPLTHEQIDTIENALNRAVFEQTKSIIPYATPLVRVQMDYPISSTKAVYSLAGINVFYLRKIKTLDGAGYLVCSNKVKHNDHEGQVLYSKHAIDRLIERTDLMEMCQTNTGIIIRVMSQAVKNAEIKMGTVGPQLTCDSFGFFPMVWKPKHKMWMLTTFLENEMIGSANDAKRKLQTALKKLSQKWSHPQ